MSCVFLWSVNAIITSNMNCLILDNGAYSAKVGLENSEEGRIIPNCVLKAKNVKNRIFVGDQVDDCKDLSGLYYLLAFQKGYLVNWEIEKQVWDHLFGKDGFKVNFDETNVIITEPYFNFNSIQEAMCEILFEEYGFQGVGKCNAGDASQYQARQGTDNRCCLVVDTGYSFTHIVPYCNGSKIKDGVRRINVGGKILTNHLKEIISYRQLMVMDETYVINQLKEDVCYVSLDFWSDMKTAKKKGKENNIVRDYVLPDYTHIKRGYVRSPEEASSKNQGQEQIIRMNNERFSVPEILFHPSDVGIQEMGIPEAIVYSISQTPEEMHPHLYGNIILTGGNCTLPGFKERIEKEVRALTPDEYDLNIKMDSSPTTYAWQGGRSIARSAEFENILVTKEEYEECGHLIFNERTL